MDIRKLEAFCHVYETQSFSKAGEAMFLSQPTISSHVANLEAELGVRLFDRLGRRVLATQAGDILYRSAQAIFSHVRQARDSIEILRDQVVGELVIGCSTIPAHHILPGFLAGFSSRYPLVSFRVQTGDSSEVAARVADGQWVLGMMGHRPESDELTAHPLLEDETVVVASSSAPWLPGGAGPVSVRELAGLPWVMREHGSATRRVLEDALAGLGLCLQDINVRCWVDGTCEAVAHVLSGAGLSVTSRLATRQMVESGALVRLDVPELVGRRRFFLVHHRERQMFPAYNAFVDHCLGR
ncbi:LysR family transcriptional regulator [Pseudodesulfovibrio sp. F-1]|uniref:LysR family transcriptional regulator n=1 Tax=Pseudodesulfovibrio alkaliphilus TaxID=2661613 RepID=A0A7K1KJ95_9BACT|nr:selenium metabolism-associated LysR family transcriptional regulator [Pseudodesulfovibrio alkaliphilus]MUM76158.1 LysR family transcriptional regulator [Pseudodesulfovibrio alkaliphilus]